MCIFLTKSGQKKVGKHAKNDGQTIDIKNSLKLVFEVLFSQECAKNDGQTYAKKKKILERLVSLFSDRDPRWYMMNIVKLPPQN